MRLSVIVSVCLSVGPSYKMVPLTSNEAKMFLVGIK